VVVTTDPIKQLTPPSKWILDCDVIAVTELSSDIYLMRLHGSEIANNASPGQFVNLRLGSSGGSPFLRRPFSVCRRRVADGWFEILWKVVGEGTAKMAAFKPNMTVNVIGPLGRGYHWKESLEHAILVAGGIGVAPLPFLCEELTARNKKVIAYLGAQNVEQLVMSDFFESLASETVLVTDDGSLGKKGLVTVPLINYLSHSNDLKNTAIFSCGPSGLLSAISGICDNFNVSGQVAIETIMGCGFGVCVGCPVQTRASSSDKKSFKLTCIDGPVFDTRESIV